MPFLFFSRPSLLSDGSCDSSGGCKSLEGRLVFKVGGVFSFGISTSGIGISGSGSSDSGSGSSAGGSGSSAGGSGSSDSGSGSSGGGRDSCGDGSDSSNSGSGSSGGGSGSSGGGCDSSEVKELSHDPAMSSVVGRGGPSNLSGRCGS